MKSDSAGLIDREREMAAVGKLLADSSAGAGRMVVVSGGAGVGKTALLDAAVGQARRCGFTVLMARGSPSERELRFGLVSRLFEPVLPQRADADLDSMFERLSEVPEQLTVEAARGSRLPAAAASAAELYALHRILAGMAADTPVMLAVDDLQWLDQQSLRWLSALPQRVEQARIAVLVSVCAGEPCVDRSVLDELLAVSSAELWLADLSVSGAAAVLERELVAVPDRSFVVACVQATGGNPALLTALAAASAEQAIAPTADSVPALADLAMPRLASSVHARLRRLSPYALAIARAVAVLGTEASIDRVSYVTGIKAPTVWDAATALNRAGLLRVEGQTITFAYPMLRDIIMREVPFAALQAVHSRAARLLHEVGAPRDCVADQLIAAPPLGERWVPTVLRRAAGAALGRGAPENAVAYLRRAMLEPASDEVRIALLVDLSRAEAHTDLVAAIRHLKEAVNSSSQHAQDPAMVYDLASLLALTGRHQAAVDLVTARTENPSTSDALRVAELEFGVEAMAEAAAKLLDGQRQHTPADGLEAGRALSMLAMRESWAGESRRNAVALVEQALAVNPAGPEGVQSLLRCVLVLSQAGHIEDAYEHCDALVGDSDRWRHGPCLAASRSVRSVVARQLGRLTAAAEDARAALDLLIDCGAPRRTGTAVELLARLVDVLVDLGSYDEAAGLIELSELSGNPPRTWGGTALLLARGRLRVATGHPADGVRDLLTGGNRLRAWKVANPAVAPWRSDVAQALVALDEKVPARPYAAEAVDLARAWGAPAPLGAALRTKAAVVGGPLGLAELEESVCVLEETASPLDLARCLFEYGVGLNRASRPIHARPVLRTAVELAQQCGSAELDRMAREELSASGGRPPKIRSAGVAALTAAELRTATLAAAGKTNRQVAELLFVQRRTVEIHLTNTYRKLGIHGREELATVLSGIAESNNAAS